MKMRIFLLITIAAFITGCKKETSYDVDKIPEDGLLLNTWQILGPFPAKEQEHFLEVDNLRQFGLDESNVTFDEFVHIQSKDSSQSVTNQCVVSDNHKIDFNKIFHYTDSTTISGNVYCACILNNDQERTLKLNFSSDDGSKIWLNHALIFAYDRIGAIKYYDNYIDLHLKKGRNLLLIKVNNVRFGWEMFAAVEEETKEGTDRNKRTFALEFGNYFLKRSVITNDRLSLNEGLPPDKYIFSFASLENKKIIVDTVESIKKPVWIMPKLKDGLYSSTLLARGDSFSEYVFKGDIVEAIQRILKKLQFFQGDAETKRNIEALTYRYRHLLKPENMGKDDTEKRDWDKKMIFLFSSLHRYDHNLSQGLDPETHFTGGVLKAYISQIDNGIQYYQLFVPRNYRKENPLPLIIELPKFMNRHPSPLETYRFANVKLFELFEHLADKYNVMILDPGCRTIDKSNMNTIDEADLWEALGDVRKKYAVDTTRMYLRGACLSCRSAMKLAVKYPDKFAAMVMVAPELMLSKIYNVYLQQNEPMNYLQNISNLPLLMIHSKLDPHSPVEVGDKFNEKAREAGFKQFTYRRLSMEFKTFYSEEYMEDIINFFIKYSLNPTPREIFFTTSQLKYNKSFWLTLNKIVSAHNAIIHAKIENNTLTIKKENVDSYTIDLRTLPYATDTRLIIIDEGKKVYEDIPKEQYVTINPQHDSRSLTKNQNIEGPFAHIFSTPFMIVPGTTGNKQENANIQALADTMNKYWIVRYYNGCRMKLDKDVTEKDVENFNLLLIGIPKSNIIFKKFERTLPIKINTNSIEIGKNKSNGSELGFYFIYPNPANPSKYIAIIGYNNPSTISLGYENESNDSYFNDVSNYGWYDFKIWDGIISQNLSSGYFDYYWK